MQTGCVYLVGTGRSLQRSVASNRGNERDIKHEPEFAVNSGYYFFGYGLVERLIQ